jgi:serine/threonine protein kinase
MAASAPLPARVLGRYALYDLIASGGMASVHFGRLVGPVGFARTVAIKRLHPQFASDPEFVSMFLDEARLAARIRHPNVVPTLDVVSLEGELFLVMEYVQGEPLGGLIKAMRKTGQPMPVPYAVAIVAGALRGLHAAHEAKDERGSPLGIVHRDVSPQNILVGIDGVPRVLDFGVAKAAGRLQITREGQLKGKMAYMPPEQIRSTGTDRRTDIYAAGAVLWEALTGQRLFQGDNDVAVFSKVLEGKVDPPSKVAPQVPTALDAIVLKSLAMSPHDRYETARDMARALEVAVQLVPVSEIGEWVEKIGADHLSTRAQTISRIESDSSAGMDRIPDPPPAPTSGRSLDMLRPALPGSGPNVSGSGVSSPGLSSAGVSSSGLSSAGVSSSGVSSSGVSSAGVSGSGVSSAGVSSSGVSNAGVSSPSVSGSSVIMQPAAAMEPSDRTEVSGTSSLHSAVVPTRFPPRTVVVLAGAGLGLIFLIATIARLLSGHPTADAEQTTATTSPSADTLPSATVGPAVAVSVAPPAPSDLPGKGVPIAPKPPPTAPRPAVPPSVLAPWPAAADPGVSHGRPPQPSRAHPLDGVLDSRK